MRKLEKPDLVELVKKITNSEGTEEEISRWIELLEENISHPAVTDLIFHSDRDLTPEEVVEQALSYKPFEL